MASQSTSSADGSRGNRLVEGEMLLEDVPGLRSEAYHSLLPSNN